MEKTGEAYSSARAHLDDGGGAAGVIHVTNPESVSLTLREAGVGGRILVQRRRPVRASGAPIGHAFRELSGQEARPFFGDSMFFVCLGQLAECEVPLLETDRGVRLTEAGREVLAGRADHLRLSGIDRWIGGVHLASRAPAWRYDDRLETLVAV